MKKIYYLFILFSLSAGTAFSQNVSINADGSPPNPNAMLDIKASDKGLLIPRTSTTTRLTIPNTKGLLVYDTTTSSFWYNDGNAWNNLSGIAGSAWSLSGNGGTDPNTNFIGTTDNKPLLFRVNNKKAGIVDYNLGSTAFGIYALSVNTGVSNTAFGSGAASGTTTGEKNTAIGSSALVANATGSENLAAGYFSLYANTGSNNTALGAFSLSSNSGDDNVALGNSALHSNTTGGLSVALGSHALYSNTEGYNNIANGPFALFTNVFGNWNTASGYAALYLNRRGNGNTANGYQSLYSNENAEFNTANGYQAARSNTSGSYNVADGVSALSNNITGSFKTAIGSDANVSTGDLTNATAIGNQATVNASNKIRLGNTSVTVIEGQVAYSFPSDARFKYNIHDNVPGLDFITRLKPVTYYLDGDKLASFTKTGIISDHIIHAAGYTKNMQLHTGFLAQDVEKIANELGYDFDGIHKPANDRDHYSLAYSQFIMPLVKGMQEQQQMIEGLQ